MAEPSESVAPHTVAARVAAIVLAIAAQRPSSQTELARLVGLPLSTTHRLLTALVSWGIVERTVHGHYELTLESTRSAGDLATLRDHIVSALADLAEVTRSTTRFGVWQRNGVSVIERSAGGRPGVACPFKGSVLPVHATALGKALLAFAPQREICRVLAGQLQSYTDRTVTTADDLGKTLVATRSCGMAVAIDELSAGHWAVAVPLFGPNGIVASLEVSGAGSLPPMRTVAPVLRYAAAALGRRLAEHPELLPTSTGSTPLRWPIDPTSYPSTLGDTAGRQIAAGGPNGKDKAHNHSASRRRGSAKYGHLSCVRNNAG
jgi:DNA-binding IclR family transcriptional regulator